MAHRFRLVVALVVMTGIFFASYLTGCGGDKAQPNQASSGSTSGSLRDVEISPYPGSAFIPKGSTFRLSWSDDAPPPPSFTVALYRYTEECDCDCTSSSDDGTDSCTSSGSVDGGSSIQATDLNRVGDSYSWELTRSDGYDLDEGGPYYIELASGDETIQSTYIVETNRSVKRHAKVITKTAVPAGKGIHAVVVVRRA